MRRFIWIILILMLLAGCIQRSGGTNPEEAAAPTSQLGGAVIVYQRTGGFAGVNEEYTIYPDGRIVPGKGETMQVDSKEVSSLLNEINGLGFFEMQGAYGTLSTCKDCFQYTLTVEKDGQVKTVSATDEMPDVPEDYWKIIEGVNQLIGSK